jgi:hypothetical protein
MSQLLQIIIEKPTYDDCMQFIRLYNELKDERTKTLYEQELNKVVFQALKILGYVGYTRGGLAIVAPHNLEFLKDFSPHSTAPHSTAASESEPPESKPPESKPPESEPFLSAEPPPPFSYEWTRLMTTPSQVPSPAHSSAATALPAPPPWKMVLPRSGPRVCEHGKLKWHCKNCGGSNFCQHGRQKSRCKECGGVGICQHGREKRNCKLCGGTNFCQHGMRRANCIDCGGTNICKHRMQKRWCIECGGSGICKHGNNKRYCKVCNSQGGSKTIKSKKSYRNRNVKMSFRKNKKVVAHKKTKRLKSSSASSRKSHVYI